MEQVNVPTTRPSDSGTLRALAEREASALFVTELARRQDDWRSALASVRQTLADLQARCDTVASGAPDPPAQAVSQLIDKIVAAAAADAEALVQQVEGRARTEAAEAQALVQRLQDEVGSGQEQLRIVREKLEAEQAARARADAAAKDAQLAHEQARAALDAQLRSRDAELQTTRTEISRLQERLAAAQAESATVSATLDALRSAVQGAMLLTAAQPPAAAPGRATSAHAAGGSAARPSATAPPAAAHATRAPVADGRLTELPANRYASALLKSVEAMYEQDVKAALPSADIVKRLTDNLRYASQLFAERLRSDPAADQSALTDQIAKLVSARSTTAFGRDLAIAAGEAERHARRDRGAASPV
jgi:hypothetical protein